MLIEEPQIQVLDPMDEFYSKKLYFSYSALKLLLWSPALYKKKYIDKQQEDKTSANLMEGKVIHCLMLNNHEFDDQFVVSPTNLPTGNTKFLVERVFNHYLELSKEGDTRTQLMEFQGAILDVMKDMDYHQSLSDDKKADAEGKQKSGDQKRIDKVITSEAINYFEYLKSKGSKDVIDQETYNKCKVASEILLNSPNIRMLMGFDDYDDSLVVINEKEFRTDLSAYSFGLKGIIDNLVIDKKNKVVRVNDLKTTGKSITDFIDTVEFFQYWLQATIYCILVYRNYRELFEQEGYVLEFRFIVIDNTQQVYAFPVSQSTLSQWTVRTEDLLKDADFHYSNKSFNLPVKYEKNLVVL